MQPIPRLTITMICVKCGLLLFLDLWLPAICSFLCSAFIICNSVFACVFTFEMSISLKRSNKHVNCGQLSRAYYLQNALMIKTCFTMPCLKIQLNHIKQELYIKRVIAMIDAINYIFRAEISLFLYSISF